VAKAQEGEGVMVGGGVRCNSLVGREKSNGKEVRRRMINQKGSEEKGSGGK
jgi:hypothetical protein